MVEQSLYHLAKDGRSDELLACVNAGPEVDLLRVFERAVTDFRSVRRNAGHQAILHWCLERGLDPQARCGWLREPAACFAAGMGNGEIVEAMLRKHPTESPYVWASIGDAHRLERLARQANLPELVDENGFNLLFYCAGSGLSRCSDDWSARLTETCRLLLEQGVDPWREVQFELPISPVFLCAARGGNARIMEQLLTHGVSPETPPPGRLHLALEHALEPHQRSGEPFYEIAHCLLESGLDITSPVSNQQRTLLHGAANRGSVKAVRWLLAHGADLCALDAYRRTPLHLCAERNTWASVAKLLVEAGADPAARDSAGRTALDYAVQHNRTKVAEYLRASGAS